MIKKELLIDYNFVFFVFFINTIYLNLIRIWVKLPILGVSEQIFLVVSNFF